MSEFVCDDDMRFVVAVRMSEISVQRGLSVCWISSEDCVCAGSPARTECVLDLQRELTVCWISSEDCVCAGSPARTDCVLDLQRELTVCWISSEDLCSGSRFKTNEHPCNKRQ
jgi:hypothetical protein